MASVRFEHLPRPLAAGLPLLALLGVGVPVIIGEPTFAILGIYLAIPLIGGGLLYFTIDRSEMTTAMSTGDRRDISFRSLVTGYAVFQAFAILLLVTNSVRPITYYLVIAVAGIFVLVQILSVQLSSTRIGVILVQIAALVLNLVWGVTFKYGYFFGRTDLFPHSWYATTLIETGRVTAAFENYEWFPLWHILAAVERLYFGTTVPPRYLFFLTNGIAYAVLVGGIYLLSRKLIDSRRIALTAALLTSLNTWVLLYGMYSIPRSLVSVLCVFAFAAMVTRGRRAFVILVVIAAGIVVYHTVSVPFFLITVATVFVVQNVFGSGWVNRPIHIRDLLTIATLQVGYWLLVARDLLAIVIRRLVSPSISGSAGTGGTGAGIPHPVNELANYLQFSLLLLFVTVAVVLGLRSDRFSRAGKAAILSGALLSAVSFPGPMLLVGRLASNFNMLRFGQYTFPLIVIAGAVGVVILADANVRFGGLRSRTALRGMVVLLVLTMGFLAVSNDFVASDNPAVEREFYTYYLSESETDGLDTVAALSGGSVLSDEIACKYLGNTEYGGECTILQTDVDRQRLLTGEQKDLVLVRTTELDRRGLQVYPTDEFDPQPAYLYSEAYLPADATAVHDLERFNKVYATDDVAAYTDTDRPERPGLNPSTVERAET